MLRVVLNFVDRTIRKQREVVFERGLVVVAKHKVYTLSNSTLSNLQEDNKVESIEDKHQTDFAKIY